MRQMDATLERNPTAGAPGTRRQHRLRLADRRPIVDIRALDAVVEPR